MRRYATVIKSGVFDAAHRNTGFGEGHKCNNIHGHTFNYDVHVRAPIEESTGLSIDFGEVKSAMKELVENVLDHKYLNEDVEYFRVNPPSAENIAFYIFNAVQSYIGVKGKVTKVILHETPTSAIEVTGDDFPDYDFRVEVSE